MYYVYVQLIYNVNHVNTIWCTLYQVSYNYYYYQQQNYFNESIILQMPIISGRNCAGQNIYRAETSQVETMSYIISIVSYLQ